MRNEQQEPANTSPLGGDSQARFLAQVKVETPRSGATILSDASGKWFYAFCSLCGWRGQAAKDKALIKTRATAHNEEKHRD